MNIYLVWFLYILLGNLILAVIYCVIDEVVCDNIHIKKMLPPLRCRGGSKF
ncbi:hypothetical protein ASFV_Kyiv_2016_131_00001 [African swine fever virus]|uniref:Uncharacterized protein n=1 Tax=African swine fever virus TaxID=10497 RepID=A0A5B8XC11_ASF|nr:hypothetical protein ASFV_Kyiv_2016_131_00001 [African swine fever virus]UUH61790.1 hypothetical protein OAOJGCID_00002 [African swine fever virus]